MPPNLPRTPSLNHFRLSLGKRRKGGPRASRRAKPKTVGSSTLDPRWNSPKETEPTERSELLRRLFGVHRADCSLLPYTYQQHFYSANRVRRARAPGNHCRKIAEHPPVGGEPGFGRSMGISASCGCDDPKRRERCCTRGHGTGALEWAMVIFMPRNYTFFWPLPRNF